MELLHLIVFSLLSVRLCITQGIIEFFWIISVSLNIEVRFLKVKGVNDFLNIRICRHSVKEMKSQRNGSEDLPISIICK